MNGKNKKAGKVIYHREKVRGLRLPKFFSMPGGYKVRVVIRDKGESDEFDANTVANWDRDAHTINLRASRRQYWRDDLKHEIGHLFVDWLDWFLRVP
ncbi:MAG: hypothetical protein L0287_09060 [Anaerolineae bacterium]|nr:hypothetical protein [Anaerolineae bacterium]